jgi:hypothetical protein
MNVLYKRSLCTYRNRRHTQHHAAHAPLKERVQAPAQKHKQVARELAARRRAARVRLIKPHGDANGLIVSLDR